VIGTEESQPSRSGPTLYCKGDQETKVSDDSATHCHIFEATKKQKEGTKRQSEAHDRQEEAKKVKTYRKNGNTCVTSTIVI
jgi:hypothetical protein